VSEYWAKIKPAAIAAMELDPLDPNTSEYSNNLFISLLNSTHQAWLIMDDERELYAMGITCIVEDNLTDVRSLHVDAFYSFQTMTDELARDATASMREYACTVRCERIHALTGNPRAARLLELVGFKAGKMEYLLSCG
jgi:hypothetical protein